MQFVSFQDASWLRAPFRYLNLYLWAVQIEYSFFFLMCLISSVYFLLKPYHLTRIDRVAGDIVPSLLMFDANEPESKVRMCDNSLRTCFLTTIVNTSRNSGNSHSNPSLGSSRNKIEQVVWRTQTTTTVMTWSLPLKFVHCSYFDHKM